MKKCHGCRQNMMAMFVAFAVAQLCLALTFKRLAFREELLFVLAVMIRLFFEIIRRWSPG